jgi:FkbM family methyltransferase
MKTEIIRRARIAGQAFLDLANWREVLPRAAAGESVTEIQLRDGVVLGAPPENALWPHFSDIWYHRSYTKHCAIPRGSLVVDIGANVGVFSVFAARVARIVYALEPSSANFARLTANTSGIKNILPLNLACSQRDGQASLDISSNPVSYSLLSDGGPDRQEVVNVVSLATLFERLQIERCDFLKLDCEGCEFEIILNADPQLVRRIGRIVMEYHDHLCKGFSHLDLLHSLQRFGFRTISYNPNGTQGMIAATRP